MARDGAGEAGMEEIMEIKNMYLMKKRWQLLSQIVFQ